MNRPTNTPRLQAAMLAGIFFFCFLAMIGAAEAKYPEYTSSLQPYHLTTNAAGSTYLEIDDYSPVYSGRSHTGTANIIVDFNITTGVPTLLQAGSGKNIDVYTANTLSYLYTVPVEDYPLAFYVYNDTVHMIDTDMDVWIFLFNESTQKLYTKQRFDGGVYTTMQTVALECNDDISGCIVAAGNSYAGFTYSDVYVRNIDYDKGYRGPVLVYSDGVSAYYQARTPRFAVADFDSDGQDEYFMTLYRMTTGDDYAYLVGYDLSSTQNLSVYYSATLTFDDNMGSPVDQPVTTKANPLITNPVYTDFDEYTFNSGQLVFGALVDYSGFKMYAYNPDGTQYDDYPEIGYFSPITSFPQAKQYAALDIFKHPRSDLIVCALFHDNTSETLTVGCLDESQQETIIGTGNYWEFSTEAGVAPQPQTHAGLSMMGFDSGRVYTQERYGDSAAYGDTSSVDWILSSAAYGFFTITAGDSWDEGTITFTESLGMTSATYAYYNTTTYETDTLYSVLTDGIYLISDEESNRGCGQSYCIESVEFNPCIDDVIRNGSYLQVVVTADDWEDDKVQARLQTYVGDATAGYDSNWSINFTSGTSKTFGTSLDTITTQSILRVSVRDAVNNESIQSIDYTFTVASQGIVWGQTECTKTYTTGETGGDEEVGGGEDTAGGNAVNDAFDELTELTGFSSLMIWLVIMTTVAVAMFVYSKTFTGWTMFAIGLVELLITIIGISVGFVGYGLLIIIVLFMVVMLVPLMRRTFMGDS